MKSVSTKKPTNSDNSMPFELACTCKRVLDIELFGNQAVSGHPVTVQYYLTYHLGTPLLLVEANGGQAGRVTWAASYNPWGNIQEYKPHNMQKLNRFAEQQLDPATRQHYKRLRYDDTNIERCLSQDPIGLKGDVNRRVYLLDPDGWIYPTGLRCNKGSSITDVLRQQEAQKETTCWQLE